MKSALIILCFIAVCDGCFSRSDTKAAPPKEVVEEPLAAQKVNENNAGRSLQQPGDVSTAELKRLTEELLSLDQNNVGQQVHVNLQGRTNSGATNDVASQPLFKKVSASSLSSKTSQAYQALLDNYVENVAQTDIPTAKERQEEEAFLNAIIATPVMKRTEQFLKSKSLIKRPLRTVLKEIWFTPYSRSRGRVGSSGFEHVFLGETKDGQVSGLHNWIFFQKEESEGDIDYKGHMKSIDLGTKGQVVKIRFDWMRQRKAVGSMFIGTSPELDMAIYTICFYTRLNKGCNIQMNREKIRVKVYSFNYKGKSLIGSAFPDIF